MNEQRHRWRHNGAPETLFTARDRGVRGTPRDPRQRQPVTPPCGPGAIAIAGSPPCADCHDEVAATMAHQIHMCIQPFEVQGLAVGCEGCHGDGTRRADEGDPALIRTFAEGAAKDAAACLS